MRVALSDELTARLRAAAGGIEDATIARDQVIIEAWKKGASLNEIGIAIGMTHRAISFILQRNDVRHPAKSVEASQAEIAQQEARRRRNPGAFRRQH